MKIEQQCASLELSKKLKELGVKQESLFYWVASEKDYLEYRELAEFRYKRASAFTVAELGEMIKAFGLPFWNDVQWTKFIKGDDGTYVKTIHGNTEADSRAQMLIYLLENKLI